MSDIVVQNGQDEPSTEADAVKQLIPPPIATNILDQKPTSLQPVRSYQPYSWKLPNLLLDIVDKKTNGRAGWMQRIISYLFFGGLAAVVNLITFYVMFHHVFASLRSDFLHNTLSYLVAAELSILANFIPNDRFTFNKLPGARRPWILRCMRFHLTALVGTGLTYIIELTLSNFLHLEVVFAEAIAIIIVLVYNFTFHHLFTYRHVKQSA